MAMKKTLLISDDFPPNIGGVANYYGQICRLLPPEKIGVLTALAMNAFAYDRNQPYHIYREKLLSTNPLMWPKWQTAVRIASRIIRAERYEKMLVGQVLPYGTVAWIIHRRLNIPYAVAVHGMDIRIPRGRKRWMVRQVLRSADQVIANSYATGDYVTQLGIEKSKILVVTPAINIPVTVRESELQTLRERYRLVGKRVILTVARLVPRKGHREVIAAFPRVLARAPNCVYVIVGSGSEMDALQRLVRLKKMEQNVIFTGSLSDIEVGRWYELCDVFIMAPTADPKGDVEGFGTVYLEAASYGKPVIGSRLPGVTEAIVDGQTGVLVSPGSSEELSRAVWLLLQDQAYAHRLGLQAHDRVLHGYTWKSRAASVTSALK